MIELKKSDVVFQEEGHIYLLGDLRLSGITSLIHEVLKLGVYPDASEFVKNVAIPRAGEYGTAIHKSIEFYDVTGMRNTFHPGRFGDWEVSAELDTYIRHKEGFTSVANEYIVSDNIRYASAIDNVWMRDDTQGIWLVDTKSNNLDYYPGGAPALQEYLSWQLSIYAVLFERQNPGLKVEGLACNWIRKEQGDFWIIERKSDEDVLKLLDTVYVVDCEGNIRFILDESTDIVPAEEDRMQLMPAEVVSYIAQLLSAQDEMEKTISDMKEQLKKAMKEAGVKSWDAGAFKVTYIPESSSTQFDSTRFKKENPEVCKAYQKTVKKSEQLRITLRNKEEA